MTLLQIDNVRVFECPNCRETINTSVSRCPYCSSTIDQNAASAAAELTSRVSQACSDASYIRILAGSIVAAWLLILVPFLSIVGVVGYYVLLVIVPMLELRWWTRFYSLRTDDPDFRRAKRNVVIGAVLWALFVAIFTMRFI
jgi:hypothetical protein